MNYFSSLGKLYFTRKFNLVFFYLNPEILAKLFNLIYYLTLSAFHEHRAMQFFGIQTKTTWCGGVN